MTKQLSIHIGRVFSIVKTYIIAVNQRFRLGIIALVCLACIFSSVPAVSQTQLPNPIRLGVRTLADPIGNNVHRDKAGGFCGIFGEELKQELAKDGKQINVKYIRIVNQHLDRDYPRYNGLKTGIIDIECGPNSNTSNAISSAEGVKFSNTFYKTGVRLLLKKGWGQNLGNIKIGVVQGTTTPNVLQSSGYSNNIKSYGSGDKALDALDNNEVQAFASDELIVWTLLEKGVKEPQRKYRPPYEESGYTIFPESSYLTGAATEEYVMAVKEGTPFRDELLNAINNTLMRDKISQAKNDLKVDGKLPWDDLIRLILFLEFVVLIAIVILIIPRINNGKINDILPIFLGLLFVFLQIMIVYLKPNHQGIYVGGLGFLVIGIGLYCLLK